MRSNKKSQMLTSVRFGTSGALGVAAVLLAVGFPVHAQVHAPAPDTPTFTRDVAPILQENCQVCHRPNSIAPMSLVTYEETRPWAALVADRVATRSMPPYFVDRDIGIQEFKDDRGLTDEDLATIVNWMEAGAPQGDLADMPPPRQFQEDIYAWQIENQIGRPPDLVVQLPEPILVPANESNMWLNIISETGLEVDRWVMAYETKPSLTGFPVVHHASTSFLLPDGEEVGFGQYALAKTGDIFPDDTGRLIPAGTQIKFNLHYSANPSGEDTLDQTSLALWFHPEGEEPRWEQRRSAMGRQHDLDLPAGDGWVRTDGFTPLHENVRLSTFQPHLHNLGARQCMNAIYPDGRTQTLSCANWDFGWHIPYQYADDVQPLLPRGTTLHVIHWHNNSETNRWAGDPRNWVGWGNRSTDDMAFAHVSYYVLTDEEFEEQVRERFKIVGTDIDETTDLSKLSWWPKGMKSNHVTTADREGE